MEGCGAKIETFTFSKTDTTGLIKIKITSLDVVKHVNSCRSTIDGFVLKVIGINHESRYCE